MRFAILGPVGVTLADQSLSLTPKERTVLATLLLRAGEPVSVATLAQTLWDDAPPPSARNTIQGYVKRLRQRFGPEAGRIVTRSPGYLVDVRPGELDLDEFTALRARAATAPQDEAAALLTSALALWVGDPLADVRSAYLRRTEVPRLTELRNEAVEARIDADLRLGNHAGVIAELRSLTARNPFRERLWEQLMVALYRAGRKGDALGAYAEVRNVLTTELGIDPGAGLADLHYRILASEPALIASELPAHRQRYQERWTP